VWMVTFGRDSSGSIFPQVSDYYLQAMSGCRGGGNGVCPDDVDDLTDVETEYINGVATVSFKRKLVTDDDKDLPIIQGGGPDAANFIIFSSDFRRNRPTPAYHQSSRGSAKIDLFTGVVSLGSDAFSGEPLLTRQMHGMFLAFSWSFCILAGFIIIRYVDRKYLWRVQAHEIMQSLGTILALSSSINLIYINSAKPLSTFTTHHEIGLYMSATSFCQSMMGWILAKRIKRFRPYHNHIKLAHIINGSVLLILSVSQVYTGFRLLFVADSYMWVYTAWVIIFGTLLVLLEYRRLQHPSISKLTKNSTALSSIPKHDSIENST
jgi:hypothetical protein